MVDKYIIAEDERDLNNTLINLSIALEEVKLKMNAKKIKKIDNRQIW